ncbi:FMN-dependent NADH-azoreductase [Novosphingobium terrae]|uniref:FMN-dependent NADH-azoreductase n=1 Tax=Novosphingobium terrae TaxID=2726189 RepID=UPI0019816F16|nr:NAD(P)H-dependent oxidoreductase [Novosphingobium terrae]
MTRILQILSSPRGGASHSTALGDAVAERLAQAHPQARRLIHDLNAASPGWLDAAYAAQLVSGQRGEEAMSGTLAASDAAIAALLAADMVVIATPMHNFTLPAVLKLWVDMVVRAFHTFVPTAGSKLPLVPDRPVFIAIASGGFFHGERANQPDFLIPYLTAALGCIGLRDLCFLPLQGTAFLPAEDIAQQTRALVEQAAGWHAKV